jgi:hypothetical protein
MQLGHDWVKRTWIDSAPPLHIHKVSKEEGGMLRQFVPSQMDDNPSLMEADPEYENRIFGSSTDPAVREALRKGNWDVTVGAFFTEYARHQHIITGFYIPPHWVRGMAMDFGSSDPCAILFYAIVPDEFSEGPPPITTNPDIDKYTYRGQLPRNSIVVYREVYLTKKNSNEGLNRTAEQIAQAIIDAEKNEPNGIRMSRVAGTDIWNYLGGPSIAERMAAFPYNLVFERADTRRLSRDGKMGGWNRIRQRLIGSAQLDVKGNIDWSTGRPALYIFENCINLVRTLPLMQHDSNYREDMAEGEDHLLDSLRYLSMRHPYSGPTQRPLIKNEAVVGVGFNRTQIDTNTIDVLNPANDKQEWKRPAAKHDRIY